MQLDLEPGAILILSVGFGITYVVISFIRGSLTWKGVLFNTAFFAYMVMLLDVTLMPLPLSREAVSPYAEINNFIPFASIYETLTRSISWRIALRNILGNVLMFMPLGMFAPILWNQRSLFSALKTALGLSVAIELTQYFIGFLLRHNYRNVDIDDVFLNTVGALLGFLVFKLLYPWIRAVLDESSQTNTHQSQV